MQLMHINKINAINTKISVLKQINTNQKAGFCL